MSKLQYQKPEANATAPNRRSSTRVKTPGEISEVRSLDAAGMSINAIARRCSYSKNTVRKILRKEAGYEGDQFNRVGKWKGPPFRAPVFRSEVDGEVLYVQRGVNYRRVTATVGGVRRRLSLHAHEALKVFKLAGRKWEKGFTLHHVDGNPDNWTLDNLSVFGSPSLHKKFHERIWRALLRFVIERDLTKELYAKYPELKLETLGDILREIETAT